MVPPLSVGFVPCQDGNPPTRRAALENRRNGYAGSTTADDENLMVC